MCEGRCVMTSRIMLAAAVAVLAFGAGTASTATATPAAAARSCGTINAASRTWSVAARGVACRTATGLVRKLAPKVHAGPLVSLGRHLGMACFGSTRTDGARAIVCSSATKSVMAASKH